MWTVKGRFGPGLNLGGIYSIITSGLVLVIFNFLLLEGFLIAIFACFAVGVYQAVTAPDVVCLNAVVNL
jgi:hypothetical protein